MRAALPVSVGLAWLSPADVRLEVPLAEVGVPWIVKGGKLVDCCDRDVAGEVRVIIDDDIVGHGLWQRKRRVKRNCAGNLFVFESVAWLSLLLFLKKALCQMLIAVYSRKKAMKW